MRPYALFQLMKADFHERSRRFGFLLVLILTLVFAAVMVPLPDAKYAAFTIDHHRGFYNAPLVGTSVALSTALFLSLIGFYLVKNAIVRDEQTGVDQLLAATPTTRAEYVFGKMLSNVLVLTAMVLVTALVTPVMLKLRGEDPTLDLWALCKPFLFITWPVMVVVSAFAVLFEIVPFLRRGLGNVIYFFVWMGFLSVVAVIIKNFPSPSAGFFDMMGIWVPLNSLRAAALHEHPSLSLRHLGLGLDLDPLITGKPFGVFHWHGMQWSLLEISTRIAWVAMALGITFLSSLLFRGFGSTTSHPQGAKKERLWGSFLSQFNQSDTHGNLSIPEAPSGLTPLGAHAFRSRFGALIGAELRLMAKGVSLYWYAIALGLVAATLVAPLSVARLPLLPILAAWPLLIWSAMGNREQQNQTNQLIFTTPWPLWRQLSATWLAGILLALLLFGSMLVRFAIAGDTTSILALLIGIFFVPTLALALGVWTGSSKFFEIFYFLLLYLGPFQKTRPLDFLGALPSHVGVSLVFLGITLLLLFLAFLGRRFKLRM